jgi:hypothetical protein
MMPKINDYKAYARDAFAKAGLGDDVLKQVLGAFDDEKTLKAFTDHFKPLPDYSHDMDDVRNRTKTEKDQEYQEWYQKEQQKYNEYVQALNELQYYRQAFNQAQPGTQAQPGFQTGTITNNIPTPNHQPQMTQQDMEKLMDARLQTVLSDTLSRRDNAVLDLLDVREQHMNTFKKSLDVKAFENAWREHPEWGGSLRQAYKSFVEPDMEKAREAEWAAKLDQKYQEGIRDGFSRRQLPTDNTSKIFSPFFDRKEDVAKMDEAAQERHSREAFFDELRKVPSA